MSWTESEAAHKLIRRKEKQTRDMARKQAQKAKDAIKSMDAEHMEMTPDIENYPGLPVVPDSYGTNSALMSGQGVPQWYGSAEEDVNTSQYTFDRYKNLQDQNATYIENEADLPRGKSLTYEEQDDWQNVKGSIEYIENNVKFAESGDDIRTAADLVAWADSNYGSLPVFSVQSAMADNEHLSMIDSDDDEVDFVFLDGTMATCILDDKTLSTFVVAYESESFDAMARNQAGEDDIEDTTANFALNYPSVTMILESRQYLTYQSGASNKFHMFWLASDSSGGYYAFNAYARIGYGARIHRVTGPTSQEQAMRAMRSKMSKKIAKGYTNVSRDFGLRAESFGAEGMITQGLPVIPDSYGTNSALSSGQGVPQWYGSADTEDMDWDRTEYEYKELEIAKPFRTAFMASLGFIVAPLVALSGLAFILGDE